MASAAESYQIRQIVCAAFTPSDNMVRVKFSPMRPRPLAFVLISLEAFFLSLAPFVRTEPLSHEPSSPIPARSSAPGESPC